MSNPDPMHDFENERADDDLLRMEEDARRYEEDTQYAEQLRQRKQWNEAWANWAKRRMTWPCK